MSGPSECVEDSVMEGTGKRPLSVRGECIGSDSFLRW